MQSWLRPDILFDAAGGIWTERILYGFAAQNGDGKNPSSGVILGPDGVLYGATNAGGNVGCSCGTVFSLSPPAVPGGLMTETILHAFNVSEQDGSSPVGNLVLGPNRMLYGTTQLGGTNNQGIVFQLAPPASPGGSWTETILHNFTGGADGYDAVGLALGPDGTLYGTTNRGGTYNQGTVFALTP